MVCENTTTFVIFIVVLILGIFYLFLPYDLIPDELGLVGFLDDFSVFLAIIYWVCNYFISNYRERNIRMNNEIRAE